MKLNQTRVVNKAFTIRVPAAGLPIGVLPLGVFVPNNSIGMLNFYIRIVANFASGGAPTLDLGTATDPNSILAAAPLAALAQGGAAEGGLVLAAQMVIPVGEELQATVAVAAYTAGNLNCCVQFVTFPNF